MKAGYGSPDCVVGRYWDDPPPARIIGGDGEVLLVTCGPDALALVVSYGASGEVDLVLDGDGDATPSVVRCRDLERNKPLEILETAPGCRVRIERNDFRLVQIGLARP